MGLIKMLEDLRNQIQISDKPQKYKDGYIRALVDIYIRRHSVYINMNDDYKKLLEKKKK